MSWIRKCSMRNPSRATIIDRIITFDEQWLIGPLAILEVPPMVRIRLNSVSLAFAVGVDQRCGDKVALGRGMCIGKG